MQKPFLLLLCLLALNDFCNAQSAVNAPSVNGVLNPLYYGSPGDDIGSQVNAAFNSVSRTASHGFYAGVTVRIPPGTYSFNNTIHHPGTGYRLECDAGTILNYSGSGNAIDTPADGASVTLATIDGLGGCALNGNPNAQSGILLGFSNHTNVQNIRITGFKYGITVNGADGVQLTNLGLWGNQIGLYVTSTYSSVWGGCVAPNAVHLSKSEVASNSQWGVLSQDGLSQNGSYCNAYSLGSVYRDNVFEGNGSAGSSYSDMNLNNDYGVLVQGNYFESSGAGVTLGSGRNLWGTSVRNNYFTNGNGTPRIIVGYGSFFNIAENAELNSTSTRGICFIDTEFSPASGGSNNHHGMGTNFIASSNEWCTNGTP